MQYFFTYRKSNMQVLVFLVIWNIFLLANVVQSEPLDEALGDVDLHAKIGSLPQKYQDLSKYDQNASRKIRALAEKFRSIFPTGMRNLPPLDPYKKRKLERIHFDLPDLWLNGDVYLSNLLLIGGQNFSLDDLEIRLRNSRIDVQVRVPYLSVEVDFKLDASISMLPVTFDGHLRINLQGVSMLGAFGAEKTSTPDKRQVFQVMSADVHGHADHVQIHVTDTDLDGVMEILGDDFSIAKWFPQMSDDIALAATSTAIKDVNKALTKFTADQILTFLNS